MLTTVKKKMKIGGKRKTPSDSSNFESLSRTMSVMSGIDFDEEYIHPQINGSLCENFSDNHFTDNAHGSDTASTVNSFHRSPSIDSGASSGFGGSNKFSKQDENEMVSTNDELLRHIEKLREEIKLKDCRLRDLEIYMDSLLARVMEHNPELLASPLRPSS